jgi:hypothetical protein
LNGRSEIWRSLGTTDEDEAAARSAQWTAKVQRLFVTLRKHGEKMTKEERELLVSRWLESSLEEAEDYRAICGPVSDIDRDTKQVILSDLWEEANEALVSCDYRKVEKEADELLKSAGLPPLDHEGAEFGRLCRRLLQVKQEYYRIESARWDGDYSYVPFLPSSSSSSSAATAHHSTKPKTVKSKMLSEVVTLYFKENARAERTDTQVKAELDRFIASLGGDRGIELIMKEDCRTYKEAMLNTRKLGPATVIKHLSNLSSIFKWSEAQGFIPEDSNPIRGLAPNKKAAKKAALDRRPFTDTELLKVFGAAEFVKQRDTNPARYWLSLICS